MDVQVVKLIRFSFSASNYLPHSFLVLIYFSFSYFLVLAILILSVKKSKQIFLSKLLSVGLKKFSFSKFVFFFTTCNENNLLLLNKNIIKLIYVILRITK